MRRTIPLLTLLLVTFFGASRLEAAHFRGASVSHTISDAGIVTMDCYSVWVSSSVGTPNFVIFSGPFGTGANIGTMSLTTIANPFQTGTEFGGAAYTVRHDRYTFDLSLQPAGTYYAYWTSNDRVAAINNAPQGPWSLHNVIVFAGVGAGLGRSGPTIGSATIDIIGRGAPYTQHLGSVDPDGGPVSHTFVTGTAAPQYNPTSLIPGLTIDAASGLISMTGAASATLALGRWAYKVRITDSSGATAEVDVLIVVQDLNAGGTVNNSPTLSPIGNVVLPPGQALGFIVTATDPDAGQTITLRFRGAIPAGATFPQVTAVSPAVAGSVFNWTPTVMDIGVHQIYFEVFDDNLTTLTAGELVTFEVRNPNAAPNLTLSAGPTAFFEGSGGVRVDTGALLTDADSPDFNGGTLTVSITGNPDSADLLSIQNQGTGVGQIGVAGNVVSYGGAAIATYSGGTIIQLPLSITFTSTAATLAAVQALLRAVVFNNTSSTPSVLARTLTFTIVDGDGTAIGGMDTDTGTIGVSVTAVNSAPVIALPLQTTSFNEGAAAQRIDVSATLSDLDSPDMNGGSLTIAITSGGEADDRLSILNIGTGAGQIGYAAPNLTFAGAAIGTSAGGTNGSTPLVITFTSANATQAAVQALMRAITYQNLSTAPAMLSKTIRFTLVDGDGVANGGADTSNQPTLTMTIVPSNTAPVLGFSVGAMTHIEGSGATPLDAGATFVDVDSGNLIGGNLTLTLLNAQDGDVLAIQNQGSGAGQIGVAGANLSFQGLPIGTFTGGVPASTALVATFTSANATPAAIQALLRALTFAVTIDNPTAVARTASIVVIDGDGGTDTSAVQSLTVNVTPTNDAPVIVLPASSFSYIVGSGQTVMDQGALVSDVDSPNFQGGSLSISVSSNGIATDILTIRSTGTLAGQIDTTGANVRYGGTVIGTFAGGTSLAPLVITFTTTAATQAAVQALAENIMFGNSTSLPSVISRTISMVLVDGDGTANGGNDTSAAAQLTAIIIPVNSRPVLTAGGVLQGYVEGASPTLIDPAMALSDPDSTNFDGGTISVTITPTLSEDDRLGINSAGFGAGQVGVAGATLSYGGATIGSISGGTSGSSPLQIVFNSPLATQAAVQAVLRAITFSNVSENPSTANRTVRFVVVDGDGTANNGQDTSVALDAQVSLTAVNDAPVIALPTLTASYIATFSGVIIDPLASLSDVDSANMNGGSLVVTIANNGEADDRLAIRSIGTSAGQISVAGASVSYGGVAIATFAGGSGAASPLTLTFTSTAATQQAVQALMASVTFSSVAVLPSTLTRTVSFVLNDGDGVANGGADTSNVALTSVTITPVNTPPVLTSTGGIAVYSENAAAVQIDTGFTLSDADSTDFNGGSLVVSFASTIDVADVIGFQNQGTGPGQISVVGSFIRFEGNLIGTASGGVNGSALTVSFTSVLAVPASAQALVRALTFSTPGDNPLSTIRTINIVLKDGDGTANGGNDTSNTASIGVTVLPVNDAPVLTLTETNVVFPEDSVAMILDNGASLSDADSTNFNTGTLTIDFTTNGDADDRLSIRNQGNGVGQIGVSGANILFGGVGIAAYTGGGDGTTPLVITFNSNNATPSALQALLRNITYRSFAQNPDGAAKTLRFVLVDGDGVANGGSDTSNAPTLSISVMAANDAPTIVASGLTATYVEDAVAVQVDPMLLVSDVDSPDMNGGSLSASFSPSGDTNDRLALRNEGVAAGQIGVSGANITFGGAVFASFTGGSDGVTPLVITFTSALATPAAVQALARNVTYRSVSQNLDATLRFVSFTLNDGDPAPSTATSALVTINRTPVNDAPTLVGGGGIPVYLENAGAIGIDPNLAIGDIDSSDFSGGFLILSFTSGNTPDDRLSIRNQGNGLGQVGVSGSSVLVSGLPVGTFAGGNDGVTPLSILFSGASATQANVQLVVLALGYSNVSDAPSAGVRGLSLLLNDGDGTANGGADSTTITTLAVSVTPINDAPVLALPAPNVLYLAGDPPAFLDATALVTDVDSPNFNGGTLMISISGNAEVDDRLTIQSQGIGAGQIAVTGNTIFFEGSTIGTFTGGASGLIPLVVSFTTTDASLAAVQALLRSLLFSNVSPTPGLSQRTISFVVSDGDGTADGGADTSTLVTTAVNLTPVNNAPIVTLTQTSRLFIAGNPPIFLDEFATLTDIDSPDFDTGSVTVTITSGGEPNDRLLVISEGSGAGQIGLSPPNLTYGGAVIGTIAGGSDGTTPLVITFTSTLATQAAVQALLRRLAFNNVAVIPTLPPRMLSIEVVDGDGTLNGGQDTDTDMLTVNTTPINVAPSLLQTTSNGVYNENDLPLALDAGVVLSDPDSPDFMGGEIRASFGAGSSTNDRLVIRHQGNGVGEVGVAGNVVSYGGIAIATTSGGNDGMTPFVVSFTSANATLAVTQAVLRNLAYQNASETPTDGVRLLSFYIIDGDGTLNGGADTSNTLTVSVTLRSVPDVLSVSPMPNLSQTSATQITATFDQAVNGLATSSFRIVGSLTGHRASGPHSAVFTGNNSNVLIAQLGQTLEANEVVTVSLTRDLTNGTNPPALPYVWRFRAASAAGLGNFNQSIDPGTAPIANAMAVGDANNDDITDIVVASGTSVVVWISNGDGTFQTRPGLSNVVGIGHIGLFDVDNDGDVDLFLGRGSGNPDLLYLNTGLASFGSPTTLPGVGTSSAMKLADINGDGYADVISANPASALTLRLGSSISSFSMPTDIAPVGERTALEVSDVDGDGDLDLLALTSAGIEVWLNNGFGSFSAGTPVVLAGAQALVSADLNGDFKDDLVIGCNGANRVYLGDGLGGFTDSTLTLGNVDSRGVDIGDIDGDGDLDLVFANDLTLNEVWINDGSAGFTPGRQNFDGAASRDVRLVNVDADGDLDAVVLHQGMPVSVYLNGPDVDSTLSAGPQAEVQDIDSIIGAAMPQTVLDFRLTDSGAGDGLPTVVHGLHFSYSGSIDASEHQWFLNGPDASMIPGSVVAGRIEFPALNLSIANGSFEDYQLMLLLAATPINTLDNETLSVVLTSNDLVEDSANSCFASANVTLDNGAGLTYRVVASRLQIINQPPATTTAGAPFGTDLQLFDAAGNPARDSGVQVDIALSAGPTATLDGTLSRTSDAQGHVTFDDFSLTLAGTGYALTATGAGLPIGITTQNFDILNSYLSQLILVQDAPASVVAGATLAPGVTLFFIDAFGNTVVNLSPPVTVSLGQDPTMGTATLSGTLTRNATNGVVTFDDLSINKKGVGFGLRFETPAQPVGVFISTSAFDVLQGAPASLRIVQQPDGIKGGYQLENQPSVEVLDVLDNLVVDDHTIVASLSTDPSGVAQILGMTNQTLTQLDRATYSDLIVNQPGVGFVMRFTLQGAGLFVDSDPFSLDGGPLFEGVSLDDRDNNIAINSGDEIHFLFDDPLLVGLLPTINTSREIDFTLRLLGTVTLGLDATARFTENNRRYIVTVGTGETVIESFTQADPDPAIFRNNSGDGIINPAPFPFPNGLSDVYAPFATAFSISGPTTKSAGTYTLDVTFTDEQLIAPTLTIDAPGTMADVTGHPLTGSGRQWQATIVVPSADGINILDGQWNVSVVGNDDFQGNVFVASSATGSFQTDTSSPQFVSVALDRDPTCYPASVPVTIDLVMNEAGLDARANLTVLDSAMSANASFTDLGGGNYRLVTPALSAATLIEGLRTIPIQVKDEAMNGVAVSVSLTIDATPPNVFVTYSTGSSVLNPGLVTLTFTFSEPIFTQPSIAISGIGASGDVPTTALTGTLPQSVFTFAYTAPSDVTAQGLITITNALDCAGNGLAMVVGNTFVVREVRPDIIANAGPDQNIDQQGTVITLDGTASTGAVSFLWTQVAGPVAVIAFPNNSITTVSINLAGEYVFRLEVTSSVGDKANDLVRLFVSNFQPMVDAGEDLRFASDDFTPASPLNIAPLPLSGSVFDPNGETAFVVNWRPSLLNSGNLQIEDPDQLVTNLVFAGGEMVAGIYEFTLEVFDAGGLETGTPVTDTVRVEVLSELVAPPVADAGPDNVAQMGAAIVLDGSRSEDSERGGTNTVLSWQWRIIEVPVGSTITLSDSSAENPSFVPDRVGTYIFGLTVTDDTGLVSREDEVTVVVNDEAGRRNNPGFGDSWRAIVLGALGGDPTKSLGTHLIRSEAILTFVDGNLNGSPNPGEAVMISALPTINVNNRPLLYHWSQVSGPGVVALGGTSQAVLTLNTIAAPLMPGNYQFDLVVGDDLVQGTPMRISLIIAPTDAAGPLPIVELDPLDAADAEGNVRFFGGGVDGVVTNNLINISAKRSPQSSEIVAWSWSQISGPAVGVRNAGKQVMAFKPLRSGLYTFRLQVTDGNGLRAHAEYSLSVSVDDPVNGELIPSPFARASLDATSLRISSTVEIGNTIGLFAREAMQGIGADWVQTRGPAVVLDREGLNANFVPPANGTYRFELVPKDAQRRGYPTTISINVVSEGNSSGTNDGAGCSIGVGTPGSTFVLWVFLLLCVGVLGLRRRHEKF